MLCGFHQVRSCAVDEEYIADVDDVVYKSPQADMGYDIADYKVIVWKPLLFFVMSVN